MGGLLRLILLKVMQKFILHFEIKSLELMIDLLCVAGGFFCVLNRRYVMIDYNYLCDLK